MSADSGAELEDGAPGCGVKPGCVERDLAQILRQLLQQTAVQRIARDHGQLLWPTPEFRSRAQIQLALVADDRAEAGSQEGGKSKWSLSRGCAVAYGERSLTLPGTDLAGGPGGVVAPQAFQRFGNGRLAPFHASRKFVRDGGIFRLQTAQPGIQF